MRKKVETKDLQIGMFVAELDRPWLQSHFLFQGFKIGNDAELKDVRETCAFVFVDLEKSDLPDPATRSRLLAGSDEGTQAGARRPYIKTFEEEIEDAEAIHSNALSSVTRVFEDVRLGNALDNAETKSVVTEMLGSIIRNPDALMLLSSLKAYDESEITHSMNVCTLALAFGRFLGMAEAALQELGIGALLHDIGETRVPSEILKKRYGLTPEQTREMQSHTTYGAEILRETQGIPTSAIEVALTHHEKINGKGYPRGLTGEEISRFARIVGIIDVYDRLTHVARGKRFMTSTDALKNMYEYRNTFFDGDLTERFIQCLGIYPIGTVVELVSGEVGVVISVESDNHLLPKLMLVRDTAKQPIYPPNIVNLKLYRNTPTAARYAIRRVLQPNSYGIDLKKYMLREFMF
ncbi:MAG TPA: HD-GYP domain-containing protein [Gammaproteobacteria bacterium]